MSLPQLAEPDRDADATTWVDTAPARRVLWRRALSLRALSHRSALLLIAAAYLLSSLVTGPTFPGAPSPSAHWKLGPIYLGRPITTWGDPPHYLVIVSSLVADGDLDLRNNYDQARAGGWDVGTRFRGSDLDRHAEADRAGRQLSFHSPFLPFLLAAVSWPFHGTEWVESVCIWFTTAATLCGLLWCARLEGLAPGWLLALGLATPLWVYARDVSTEPYQAIAWAALLVLQSPLAVAAVVIGAVLIKITFVIVPLTLGAVALTRGQRRAGLVLIASSLVALAIAAGTAQYVFRDADHFSLFHVGYLSTTRRATFRPRWDGLVGLLIDPENGLLLFCPFLVLGIPAFRRDARLLVPALAYFLFHASYSGWRAGSGVSARYLIPMLPVLVLAVSRTGPRGRVPALLVAYSAVIATIAGVLPVAAYDKTPWGMVEFLAQRIALLFG